MSGGGRHLAYWCATQPMCMMMGVLQEAGKARRRRKLKQPGLGQAQR